MTGIARTLANMDIRMGQVSGGTIQREALQDFWQTFSTYMGTTTADELAILAGATVTTDEINYLDITALGTGAASKAVVLDEGEDFTWPATGVLTYGGTGITANGAEINYLDITTLGTGAVSKAVVLDANGAYVGPTGASSKFTWSVTSDSTNESTSVEPFVHNTTMTGEGGVGGRARFELDTNVALGGWANALKAQTEFGSSGSVTGLGSAFVGEMILSAGTTSGTYTALEAELVANSEVSTGTATSFLYGNIAGSNSTGKTTINTNGYLMELGSGVVDTEGGLFDANAKAGIGMTHTLKCRIGGTVYYLPLHTSANFGGS